MPKIAYWKKKHMEKDLVGPFGPKYVNKPNQIDHVLKSGFVYLL